MTGTHLAPGAHGAHLAAAPTPDAAERRAVVIVTSTRAAAGVYADRTGPVIAEWLDDHGFAGAAVAVGGRDFAPGEPVVVADGPAVGAALRAALDAGVQLIVTTGGTGVGAGDVTADATAELLTAPLPGFSEELRRRGSVVTPFALMSRGVAGVAGRTFIVNLPGSTGGVRDGLQLLGEVIDHVLDQLAGGGHDA
ncbi:MogA/MoaB family molybdenum cofactor biosynthesis protein [Galbitalea soli]|uniref:MogA/MoaB family molybdenum cofactor biosynthesis protein n=1 Tax=Galbitalea soli TaxID=1268042 RepID=A0A7C9PMI1_9MICO|nr:molybdopterin-binding protein [Galbitalea soli]NEM90749.1 MogA/MoaB family molybdenum cofactor biosynthesis protein [Galbitalea soli]NYJ31467.1 molybdenum cofactor synthesis domain-containing protein [Galbitalea soli]